MIKYRKIFIIQIVFISLFFISCKENKKPKDTFTSIEQENKNYNLKVLGELKKKYLESYSNEDYIASGCSEWEITKNQVEKVFLKMEKHNNNEIPYIKICYFLPCHYYEGEVLYNNKKYHIKISAASYIILTNEKEEEPIVFILKEENDNFLIACDCCKDDIEE